MRFPRFLCLLTILAVSPAFAATDDWPMPRHDACLTGRSPQKGAIHHPAVIDKLFSGAYEGLAIVTPGPGSGKFAISATPEIAPDYYGKHSGEWTTGADELMTAGDPRLASAEGNSTRYADVLPDIPGLEKIVFDDAFGGKPDLKGHLYAMDGKEPRLLWDTEKAEDDMYAPTILVLDADNDSLPDIVVATHYRVMVFDPKTGAKKSELRWHHGRNYGFFGSFMMPGDPYPKFIVIADFISHIDSVDNNGKELKLLWRNEVEATIMRKQKITRPGPNPIGDLDGDGRPEVTLNIYNDTGDKKWHVIAYDAMTGKTHFDLPATYLHGMADTDGDGLPELFVENTRGLAIPKFGPIRLLSLKGGVQAALWSHQRGRWQTTSLSHFPLTSNTIAADGHRTILLNRTGSSVECYAITEAGGKQTVNVVRRDKSGVWALAAGLTASAGSQLDIKGFRKSNGATDLLVAWKSDGVGKQSFTTARAKAQIVSWRATPGGAAWPVANWPIVARLRPSEPPTLIFQNGNDEMTARWKVNGQWRTRWTQPGHGMARNAPEDLGILAADVNGDGNLEVLFARIGKSGEAELVAVDPEGKLVWAHTFKGFDGPPPPWNIGGLTGWAVGHFAHKDHMDVFASCRRSTMHSDEGFGLCGKTGKQIWWQEKVVIPGLDGWENTRGYAGSEIAAADINGDGFDELICLYPDRFWTASGKTGEIIAVVNTANDTFPKMWVAYAIPEVADYGAGKLQVLWGGTKFLTAIMDLDGKPIWYGNYNDGPSALQGIGNVDGSGKLSIGGTGYSDGFRCMDGVTGDVKWTYAPPNTGFDGPTITADIDGDGVEEFLFTRDKTLYALNGKDGKPNVVWQLDLPAAPGKLIFADADGDGRPEIICGANDGHVYLIGEAK